MFRGRSILLILTACVPAGCGEEAFLALRLLPPAVGHAGRSIVITPALSYAERDGRLLQYDFYQPMTGDTTGEPRPLIILVQGDGWRAGSRRQLIEFAYDLAANGYAAAAIDYRLADRHTCYPAPVVDVVDAVAYFRTHAHELAINPARIALLGASAGAHLALLAGLPEDVSVFDPRLPAGESAGVKVVVDLFGPTDLQVDPPASPEWLRGLVENFLGRPLGEAAELRCKASPIRYVRRDGPAVFIVHGAADSVVPVSQARALAEAMSAVGQDHHYIEIPDMEHTVGAIWAGPFVQSYRAALLRFLAERL